MDIYAKWWDRATQHICCRLADLKAERHDSQDRNKCASSVSIECERGEEVRRPANQNLHWEPCRLEKRWVKLDEGDQANHIGS
ncbi:MAG: hypothetical protein NTV67_03445 [Chloroflexi bacterium]|nr:hypothetical protein [Chloroflexota bacterium]